MSEIRSIKIAYADMWPGFQHQEFGLERILSRNYEVHIDQKNPEIVICGPFGSDFLNYDCIRLQFIGEGLSPNFNLYDYAIGFDHLEFSNRYLRMPLYMFDTRAVELASKKHLLDEEFYRNKNKFCNFIVSNPDAMKERREFFEKLSQVKRVDSAGGYMNNMPNGERCDDLIEFRKPYKFTLSFENSQMDGYVTEKILYALAAGTVPIYYGANMVERDFNPDAFVDVTSFSSVNDCIDYILYLNSNLEEYMKIVRQPAFLPETDLQFDNKIKVFMDGILSYGLDTYRRTSKKTVYGRILEERIKEDAIYRNKRENNVFSIWMGKKKK